MKAKTTLKALTLLATVALSACNDNAAVSSAAPPADSPAPVVAQNPVAPNPVAQNPAPGTAPTGLAPITSRGSSQQVPSPVPAPPLPVGAGASDGKILAPGASFDLPAGWQSETPSSSMRLAQAVVPGSSGPGQLAVFYFGAGGGGGVEDNLQRWIGQLNLDAGKSPERDSFEVGAFRISWVKADGTLIGGTMGGPASDTPGSSLLGAVVEGDQGPWFFKLTGPAKTVAEQREAFLGMLRSVRAKI